MSFPPTNGTKLPHTLRFAMFMMRLALGLDFFYLGLSTVFEPGLRGEFGTRSLGDLYLWLGTLSNVNSLQSIAAWAFLIIGACLILGLFTRLSSFLGIVLVILSFIPAGIHITINLSTFISDGIIVILGLLILIAGRAGTYIGLDRFIHLRVGAKGE